MPEADKLCSQRFTSTGKMPTHASMIPMMTNSVETVRGERLFVRTPASISVCMSLAIYTANVVTSSPPAIKVPLKTKLERSSNVPSWLKCTFHHSGSGVVSIAVSVPITMKAIKSDDMRWVVIRDTDR